MKRKLRMGMVGGGIGAFIGGVHRMAARLDGKIDLVCGAFSSSPEKSKRSGKELLIPEDRVYNNFEEMIDMERKLPDDKRMDFISIVTPNHMHFAPSKLAIENGFDVICDKPLCFNMQEARELEEIVENNDRIFALTHNYTGYPLVKHARHMVSSGEIGTVRKIVAEYPQGWLSTKLEDTDQKQASWRTDPSKSGIAGCIGDIGTHAENLAEYITGLRITEVCADISSFVPGRKLDDDGNILLRFENGAKGLLFASQIAAGEENNLKIRIYGTKAGLEWSQMEPNTLIVRWLNAPTQYLRTGVGPLAPAAQRATRIPAGHPEGYLEAFANIYSNFADVLSAKLEGVDPDPLAMDFPDIHDGVRGMQFIYKSIESAHSEAKWIQFPTT